MKRIIWAILLLLGPLLHAAAQKSDVIPGAERMKVYLPFLEGKRVGVFANPTSMVGTSNLVDTLRSRGINIVRIFGPEHGFRGDADAGKNVADFTDPKTGIRVISLYGKHEKPTREDLKGVDVLVFDIQDVGIRFYTYISSLQYFMEAAFENSIPLILLDRPNPNGFYVDGPVLDPKFKSFVGMQPVPIVYGMTMGEYAFMIAGEKWLSDSANKKFAYFIKTKPTVDTPFHFLVIKCLHYDHTKKYVLPVKPSPNLPTIQSVYCYPTTCLFEGTSLSEGRGTAEPFQIFGAPSLPKTLYSFTPEPTPGASKSKHYGQKCYGWKISGSPNQVLQKVDRKIQLNWILRAYKLFPDKSHFFLKSDHFDQLAGNDLLKRQIQDGVSESSIRKSWEPALSEFKKIRKKYLLYKDF